MRENLQNYIIAYSQLVQLNIDNKTSKNDQKR